MGSMSMRFGRAGALGLAALAATLAFVPAVSAETTLKVSLHSDLKIVDPVWTTALISTHHGMMIYDTLFALDRNLQVKPQMVDKWTVSEDKLTWTFTLRDGLEWHDGQPVTAEDCVASLQRWSARDGMGQKLMSFVAELKATDAKTFVMKLKEPYGLVLSTLGKPTSNIPFMMPKRVAETSPNTQITETIGSGPFIFKKDEWKPGEKAVYLKNPKYKPRPEPASGFSGGKQAKVDRVEWIWIADAQTSVNALLNGEIDFIEAPPHDLLPLLGNDANIQFLVIAPMGRQYAFRFNVLHKPFDNAQVRQAVAYALNQKDFLDATIGNPKYYVTCKSMFPCGSPFETTKGWDDKIESNIAKAKELLSQASYDGTPVVLMQSTDIPSLSNLAPVAKSLLGEGRLQGRPAGHGLADAGVAARQEGPARQRRVERLPDLVGLGRRARSRRHRLPQCQLRQGDLRLAVRCRDRAAARYLRQGDRSGQAEGDRGSGVPARRRISDARLPRPVPAALGLPQEHLRRPGRNQRRALEHREKMTWCHTRGLSPVSSQQRVPEQAAPWIPVTPAGSPGQASTGMTGLGASKA